MDFLSLIPEVLPDPVPPRGKPWPRLDELDALMRGGPGWLAGPVVVSPNAFANFTIARLRQARGTWLPPSPRSVGARSTVFRRTVESAAFLRQEGRLAASTGDVDGAIDAYDRYLTLRTDAMPSLRPQRDSVLAERAALGTGSTC